MSNENYDDRLDKIIKDAFSNALDSVEVPPVNEEWKKFDSKFGDKLFGDKEQYLASVLYKKNLEEEQSSPVYLIKPHNSNETNYLESTNKKSSYIKVKGLAVACIFLIILGFIIAVPQKATAMGEWLIQFFRIKSGDTTENIQRSENISGQRHEGLIQIKPEELTFNEAQQITPFKIKVPNYLPDKIIDSKYFCEKFSKNLIIVTTQFYNKNGVILRLEQKNAETDNEHSRIIDTDDAVFTPIKVNDADGYYIEFKDDTIKLNWSKDRFTYILVGKYNIETMIRIAESIK